MFLLMLKTEKPRGLTSLDFIGAFETLTDAAKHAGLPFCGDVGYGNKRMLSYAGGSLQPKRVWLTELSQGSCHLIAEF